LVDGEREKKKNLSPIKKIIRRMGGINTIIVDHNNWNALHTAGFPEEDGALRHYGYKVRHRSFGTAELDSLKHS
jgi:hypothetical protein